MADVTGTIREEFGGKVYDLRLSMRGLARLQVKYGDNVAGLLDGTVGEVPKFDVFLDIVSEALQKGSKLPVSEADDLADELLTADVDLVERVIAALFPKASINGAAPGKAKGPEAAA